MGRRLNPVVCKAGVNGKGMKKVSFCLPSSLTEILFGTVPQICIKP